MNWSWRKALNLAPPPAPVVEAEKKPMKIGFQDLVDSARPRERKMTIDQTFAPYEPMEGIVPSGGLAMDAALPAVTNPVTMAGAMLQNSIWHEGLGFLGYAYLSELSLRVEYRHACEIWAEHSTRKWIKLRGDDDKVKQISDELTRLDARAVFNLAAVKDHLFGRSQIFLDFDDSDDANEIATELLIKPEKISKKRPLKRLKVVEPMWSYPAPFPTQNPLSSGFYQPQAWYVQTRLVHASRLLTIVGREVPDILKPAFAFGGQSLTALMKPYVDNWLRTRQSVSDLLHSFSTMVLGTDMDAMLTPGAATTMASRVAYFNNYRDNNGLMVVNKATEALTNVAAPIAGLEGLQGQSQEQLAAAARVPLSLYLQITPTGLNASSDGEIRQFYADVHSYQEDNFRGPLKTVIDVVQLSLFGAIDPEIGFEFEPLWEMSAKERAEIGKLEAEADHIYVTDGVVSNEETRERVKGDETSLYFGVDLSAEAPDASDTGDQDDDADPQSD